MKERTEGFFYRYKRSSISSLRLLIRFFCSRIFFLSSLFLFKSASMSLVFFSQSKNGSVKNLSLKKREIRRIDFFRRALLVPHLHNEVINIILCLVFIFATENFLFEFIVELLRNENHIFKDHFFIFVVIALVLISLFLDEKALVLVVYDTPHWCGWLPSRSNRGLWSVAGWPCWFGSWPFQFRFSGKFCLVLVRTSKAGSCRRRTIHLGSVFTFAKYCDRSSYFKK